MKMPRFLAGAFFSLLSIANDVELIRSAYVFWIEMVVWFWGLDGMIGAAGSCCGRKGFGAYG